MRKAAPVPSAPNSLNTAPVSRRTRGTVATVAALPVPFAAYLGSNGVLSWEWTTAPKRAASNLAKIGVTTHLSRKTDPRLWKQFAALAETDDESIRLFAERWGPLGRQHPAARHAETESVHDWRRLAGVAGAILRCAPESVRARARAEADWRIVCSWLDMHFDPHLLGTGHVVAVQRRFLLAQALNRWYAQGAGHALVSIEKDRLIIRPFVTTLFAVIGLQLAYQVTAADRMLVCYHCQGFFPVRRKPPTGARTFCPKCRRASRPVMYAMRDYRQRQAARP